MAAGPLPEGALLALAGRGWECCSTQWGNDYFDKSVITRIIDIIDNYWQSSQQPPFFFLGEMSGFLDSCGHMRFVKTRTICWWFINILTNDQNVDVHCLWVIPLDAICLVFFFFFFRWMYPDVTICLVIDHGRFEIVWGGWDSWGKMMMDFQRSTIVLSMMLEWLLWNLGVAIYLSSAGREKQCPPRDFSSSVGLKAASQLLIPGSILYFL